MNSLAPSLPRSLVALVALLSSAACSSAGTSPSTPADPAPEDATPSPIVCGEGSYATAAGACERFPALSVTRSNVTLAPARDHHTSMVIETSSGPWLYVFGGADGWQVLLDDVQRAKIGPDGALGPFEPAGKLPEARAGHCMVKRGDKIHLVGGVARGVNHGPSETSVVLTLDAEGKVTASAPGPKLPAAVMHLSCDLAGDWVYALGGKGRNGKTTTMAVRAKLAPDGTLGAFEKQTTLDPDRSHHAAFVRGSRLYLLGGLRGDPAAEPEERKDVVFAEIDADGALGPWNAAGALPAALSVSSAQLYKDAVYVFGGLEPSGFTTKIRRATFEADGTLTKFDTLAAKLPDPRGHVHQTPMHGPFIYSVGGKDSSEVSLGEVDVGRFE